MKRAGGVQGRWALLAFMLMPWGSTSAASEPGPDRALKFLETFLTRAWIYNYPDTPIISAKASPCQLILTDRHGTMTISFAKLNSAKAEDGYLKISGQVWEDSASESFADRWTNGMWLNFGASEPAERAQRAFEVLIDSCDSTRSSGF
jgi:hypothetical protein